jgi:hypothetical protein
MSSNIEKRLAAIEKKIDLLLNQKATGGGKLEFVSTHSTTHPKKKDLQTQLREQYFKQ